MLSTEGATDDLLPNATVLHCRWHDAFEAGDHNIVVGRVTQLEERDEARPLLYYDRDYRSVSAPADP